MRCYPDGAFEKRINDAQSVDSVSFFCKIENCIAGSIPDVDRYLCR